MLKLIEKKEDLKNNISIIKNLKSLAVNPTNGWMETVKYCLKLLTFVYACGKEISLQKELDDIEKLLYIEQRKLNNEQEADSNEGIG